MLNGWSQAIKYKHINFQMKWCSPLNSVCMHMNVWAVVEKERRLMKTTGRPE